MDGSRRARSRATRMWTTQPDLSASRLRSISVPTWIVDADHDEASKRSHFAGLDYRAGEAAGGTIVAGYAVMSGAIRWNRIQESGEQRRRPEGSIGCVRSVLWIRVAIRSSSIVRGRPSRASSYSPLQSMLDVPAPPPTRNG